MKYNVIMERGKGNEVSTGPVFEMAEAGEYVIGLISVFGNDPGFSVWVENEKGRLIDPEEFDAAFDARAEKEITLEEVLDYEKSSNLSKRGKSANDTVQDQHMP